MSDLKVTERGHNIAFERAQAADAPEIERLYRQLDDNKNINVTGKSIQTIREDKSNFSKKPI